MKTTKLIVCFVAMATMLFAGCSKDDNGGSNNNTGNGNDNNGGVSGFIGRRRL